MAATPEDVCPCCGGPYPSEAERQRDIVTEMKTALAGFEAFAERAQDELAEIQEGEDG